MGLQTQDIILIQVMVLYMHLHLPTLDMRAILEVMAQSMAETMGTNPTDWTIVETIGFMITSVV